VFVLLTDANVSADEASILDKAEADLPSRAPVSLSPTLETPQQSWWPVWKSTVIAASFALAAGAIWVLFFAPSADRQERYGAAGRTLEARLSGQPYSEFVRTRTGASSESGRQAGEKLDRISGDHYEIGKFYLMDNNVADAVIHLEMAEATSPNSVEIHNDLGVAYMESTGDSALDKAIAELQRALNLNPRYEPARFNLALAYEREGKFSQAEQQLQEYLRLDASSSWAKEVRSKLQLLKH
jgi:tetratricopeptide (TPR) repeat protein